MSADKNAGAPADDWRERLKSAAVLGAGGKMGSGIAWVVLKAMADLDAQSHGTPGSGACELVLVDADRSALPRLREYLGDQLRKSAEKNISQLRMWAKDRADLIENGETIEAYVDGALAMTTLSRDDIIQRLAALDGWTLDGAAIRKQFTFAGFPEAVAFVGRLVPGAETADHHPDVTINYKRVTLRYSTHSEGGLTEKDFAGAAMADGVA